MFTSLIKTKCHGMVLKEWEERQLLEWKKKKKHSTPTYLQQLCLRREALWICSSLYFLLLKDEYF